MRGKRSKQYRKLMQQYSLTFGFREPYQVVVDAEMLHDSHRFAMDLAPALARTLHGDVKPMITQCSIRHLFALPITVNQSAATHPPAPSTTAPPSAQPSSPPVPPTSSSSNDTASSFLTTSVPPATKTALLALARTLTLRKCNHHTLPAPLSPLECLASVLDPKQSGENRHRLVLAAQDASIRAWARATVRGVPAVYLKRSVMVLEPMTGLSARVREGWERGKLAGDREARGGKRGREDDEGADERERKKRKARGPKGPNPLSVKKKKKKVKAETTPAGEGKEKVGAM